jgi:4'-phosphopantetheinyl transferase
MISWKERCQPIQLLSEPNVFFWVVDLQEISSQEAQEACSFLDSDSSQRLKRFVFEEDQNRYAVAHASLRSKIGEFIQQHPSDIALLKNKHGKPYVENNQLYFNLSHTKKRAFFGIHLSCPIGLDIEDHQISVRNVCEDPEIFLRFWCAEEAYLKAIGTGFISQRPKLEYFSSLQRIDLFKKDETEIHVYNGLIPDVKLAVCILKNAFN